MWFLNDWVSHFWGCFWFRQKGSFWTTGFRAARQNFISNPDGRDWVSKGVLCVCVCACLCFHVCICLLMCSYGWGCVCVEVRGPVSSLMACFPPYVLRQGLLNRELVDCASLAFQIVPRIIPCLHIWPLGLQMCLTFTWVLGTSCFCSKYITHWTIFSVLRDWFLTPKDFCINYWQLVWLTMF